MRHDAAAAAGAGPGAGGAERGGGGGGGAGGERAATAGARRRGAQRGSRGAARPSYPIVRQVTAEPPQRDTPRRRGSSPAPRTCPVRLGKAVSSCGGGFTGRRADDGRTAEPGELMGRQFPHLRLGWAGGHIALRALGLSVREGEAGTEASPVLP